MKRASVWRNAGRRRGPRGDERVCEQVSAGIRAGSAGPGWVGASRVRAADRVAEDEPVLGRVGRADVVEDDVGGAGRGGSPVAGDGRSRRVGAASDVIEGACGPAPGSGACCRAATAGHPRAAARRVRRTDPGCRARRRAGPERPSERAHDVVEPVRARGQNFSAPHRSAPPWLWPTTETGRPASAAGDEGPPGGPARRLVKLGRPRGGGRARRTCRPLGPAGKFTRRTPPGGTPKWRREEHDAPARPAAGRRGQDSQEGAGAGWPAAGADGATASRPGDQGECHDE